jgi:hypothetical protein
MGFIRLLLSVKERLFLGPLWNAQIVGPMAPASLAQPVIRVAASAAAGNVKLAIHALRPMNGPS